ncbi:MAG: hypothetical protein J6Q34_08670 [Bacteroidales bacterium]|nr:hypothetical protein [Bacteroidales bacterium]
MMRHFINILFWLCSACTLCVVANSCNKEQLQGNGQNDTVKVELAFSVGDEQATKATSTIGNVMVWAFEIDNNGNPVDANGAAAAYVSAEFNNSRTTEVVGMYIPVFENERHYRFFAVVNKGALGKIYKAHERDEQQLLVLDSHTTYNQLSTAVFGEFDAVAANTLMPFSHWKDATFKKGMDNPATIRIEVFRPVAKSDFYAKTADGANYSFYVEQIKLFSSKIAIPVEGALFSDYTGENLENATSPSIFGDYSGLQVSTQPQPATLYNSFENNTPIFVKKEITESKSLVGWAFIYENNHGDEWSSNYNAGYDPTLAENYPTGSLYLEISYSYSKLDNGDDSGSGKCYMPLPRIVRNNNYMINAIFDINKEGALVISYSVQPWTEVNEQLDFKYPTVEISAVKKHSDGTPDYDQPVTRYNSKFFNNDSQAPDVDGGAFAFYFKMAQSDVADRQWTVHHTEYTLIDGTWVADNEQGDDFILAVCQEDNDNIIKNEGTNQNKVTFTPHNILYQIRLYPKKAASNGVLKGADIYITYPASWLGGNADELLINAGGGGTLWSNSGGERYKIRVIQGEDM